MNRHGHKKYRDLNINNKTDVMGFVETEGKGGLIVINEDSFKDVLHYRHILKPSVFGPIILKELSKERKRVTCCRGRIILFYKNIFQGACDK